MNKSIVMEVDGKEGLECYTCVDGIRLEQVSEFKYFGCTLNESGAEVSECCRKIVSVWKIAGAIRSLVNAMGLQLQCERVLHETFLVPILLYNSETMIWRE